MIIDHSLLAFFEARRLADSAKLARLPSFHGITQNVLDGGLLVQSPIIKELHEQAMPYVDRIFRGANPAELPVAMPNKMELSINLQTAKALGLTIPSSILLRADRVIE